MSYELATIIKGFYDDGNIFFYNYKYGTKPCVGFAPISKKADLISKGIIKEADVIATYDIQKDIDDLYAKALRWNTVDFSARHGIIIIEFYILNKRTNFWATAEKVKLIRK